MTSTDMMMQRLVQESKSDRGMLIGGLLQDQLDEARNRPKRRSLFGPFWSEREIAFLYGPTGIGKSVLALQIAAGIGSGRSYGFTCDVPAQPVIFLDFENDAEDLVARADREPLPNIHRLNIDPAIDFSNLIDDICKSIALWCKAVGSKVVIIDNVTWLLDSHDQRKDASVAAELMKKLKALKDELELAILVIGHTPKAKRAEPLTTAHLFGSSMLGNYANSMFALGQNNQTEQRYLIQTKRRGGKVEYGSSNVMTCNMDRRGDGLLQLIPESCMPESEVLCLGEDQAPNKSDQIRELLKDGKSVDEVIASGIASKSLVYRVNTDLSVDSSAGSKNSIPLQSPKETQWNGKSETR